MSTIWLIISYISFISQGISAKGQPGTWSEWEPWNDCSATCGPAIRWRMRRCFHTDRDAWYRHCNGLSIEHIPCENKPCVIVRDDNQVLSGSNDTIDDPTSEYTSHEEAAIEGTFENQNQPFYDKTAGNSPVQESPFHDMTLELENTLHKSPVESKTETSGMSTLKMISTVHTGSSTDTNISTNNESNTLFNESSISQAMSALENETASILHQNSVSEKDVVTQNGSQNFIKTILNISDHILCHGCVINIHNRRTDISTEATPPYNKAYIRPTGPRPTRHINDTLENDPELREAIVFTIFVSVSYVMILVVYYWVLCHQKYVMPRQDCEQVNRRADLLSAIRHNMRGSEDFIGYKEDKTSRKSIKGKDDDVRKTSLKSKDRLGDYQLIKTDETRQSATFSTSGVVREGPNDITIPENQANAGIPDHTGEAQDGTDSNSCMDRSSVVTLHPRSTESQVDPEESATERPSSQSYILLEDDEEPSDS